jgi:hypothetical protein
MIITGRVVAAARRGLLAAAALLGLTACNGEGFQAGGEYSGMPDTPIQTGRASSLNQGYIRNDGTLILNRETGNYQPYPRR